MVEPQQTQYRPEPWEWIVFTLCIWLSAIVAVLGIFLAIQKDHHKPAQPYTLKL